MSNRIRKVASASFLKDFNFVTPVFAQAWRHAHLGPACSKTHRQRNMDQIKLQDYYFYHTSVPLRGGTLQSVRFQLVKKSLVIYHFAGNENFVAIQVWKLLAITSHTLHVCSYRLYNYVPSGGPRSNVNLMPKYLGSNASLINNGQDEHENSTRRWLFSTLDSSFLTSRWWFISKYSCLSCWSLLLMRGHQMLKLQQLVCLFPPTCDNQPVT
jgi:hypothetical protein